MRPPEGGTTNSWPLGWTSRIQAIELRVDALLQLGVVGQVLTAESDEFRSGHEFGSSRNEALTGAPSICRTKRKRRELFSVSLEGALRQPKKRLRFRRERF